MADIETPFDVMTACPNDEGHTESQDASKLHAATVQRAARCGS
jgi:hypothetical protein